MEGNILFIHAGLDPTAEPGEFLNQSRFGAVHECHWAWIRGKREITRCLKRYIVREFYRELCMPKNAKAAP
jgi:hypothetical protein